MLWLLALSGFGLLSFLVIWGVVLHARVFVSPPVYKLSEPEDGLWKYGLKREGLDQLVLVEYYGDGMYAPVDFCFDDHSEAVWALNAALYDIRKDIGPL